MNRYFERLDQEVNTTIYLTKTLIIIKYVKQRALNNYLLLKSLYEIKSIHIIKC